MPTETRFDLSITLANDAMLTPDDVARALLQAAAQLDGLQAWYDTERPVRDANGNTVGRWIVDAYTHDA